MNIRIIVVTHKDYQMPEDGMYLPVCVGVGRDAMRNKFQPDDGGDNISDKNVTYCELTGVYWAWKNLDADYLGVCHYRRYFASPDGKRPMSKAEMEQALKKCDIIVSKKRSYPFYSLESHYCKSVNGYYDIHKNDMNMLRRAVSEVCPEYSRNLDKTLSSSGAHMLNMFVMPKDKFDAYCEWLFKVIDRTAELLRDRADQRRFAGALSELLLDVWLEKNGYEYREAEVLELEKRSFTSRLIAFIKRKL